MDRITRKYPQAMEEVMADFIREMKLTSGLNIQRVFSAWDSATGAGKYTVSKFFRDGTLFVTLGSSMLRNQLYFRKDEILRKMNDILAADPLFVKDAPDTHLVKNIVMR